LTQAKALLESLKRIPDYRVDIGEIGYPLAEVLFMVIFQKKAKREEKATYSR